MSDDLTRDNPHYRDLQRPTGDVGRERFAINCNSALAERVREYVRAGFAENTQIAYVSDLGHFQKWGGSLPASAETVAEYLVAHADSLSLATLQRRLAALSVAHASQEMANPLTMPLVKSVMRGLRRTKGIAQRQAQPLLKEDLMEVLDATGDRLKDLRDRALLLTGFAGGFRRSELVSLNFEDIEFVRQGMIVTVRRSKTDQNGEGRKIGIPFARGRWCPVSTLNVWKEAAGFQEGALFRPINRHQHVSARRLSGEAVCLVVKARAKAAGLNYPGYSGHSLRAGFATSAAQAGAPSWKIRQQTGHASDAVLARYIRDGELFRENAVEALL